MSRLTVKPTILGLTAAIALPLACAEGPLHGNPFNDPFVQVTAARKCAAPRGPAYSEAELRQEAHYRAERGTCCWLAGRCAEPNAHRYDPRIAEAAVQALRAEPLLADSAIWLIAQGRILSL